MLSTSGDEVIQVASPSKNFFTLALPAARQLDRGERKSACVGALFWIIRACAIVVGLCRGVKTFLMLISLCRKAFELENEVRRESLYARETNFAR